MATILKTSTDWCKSVPNCSSSSVQANQHGRDRECPMTSHAKERFAAPVLACAFGIGVRKVGMALEWA